MVLGVITVHLLLLLLLVQSSGDGVEVARGVIVVQQAGVAVAAVCVEV
jgi:hypothetical protein